MRNKKLSNYIIFAMMLTFIPLDGFCISQEEPQSNPPLKSAASPIVLSYGTLMPEIHFLSQADNNVLAEIERRTNGMVKFKTYFGGSLISGKGALEKLKTGVCDIANVIPDYEPSMLLSKGQRGFWYGCSVENALAIYNVVCSKIPEIETEWADVMVLSLANMPGYQLLTTKRPVRKLEDFRGLRLKCLSNHIGPLKDLGAEGIVMPVSDVYISLQKGIIDGVIMSYDTLKSFHLSELIKYATRIDFFPGPFPNKAMNQDSFDKLPTEIQKVFKGIREFWSFESERISMESMQKGLDAGKMGGVEFIELQPDELYKIYKLCDAVALEDAAKLDAKGLPGTKVFKEIRYLVQEYHK
ncbi:MAG: TRAP transporter substrate-binding protein DctP [Deltaproteobacteria bacterium]|nr:TRAP transporter substrate-binding protein DctP [Deltaproteobacteria bacterium]